MVHSAEVFLSRLNQDLKQVGASVLVGTVQSEPSPTFNLNIRGQIVTVVNEALCSFDDLHELYHIASTHSRELIDQLPPDHPWRAKPTHGLQVAAEAQLTFGTLLDTLREENFYLLVLMAALHDLGRPLEAIRKKNPTYEGRHHGHFSVELLNEWGALQSFSADTAQLIRYVIEHHADKSTPVLPENPTELDKLKYLYTAMIRDLDKVGLFRHKTHLYLWDRREKAAQEEVLRKLNPAYRGEIGVIDSPRYLEEFQQCWTLDRKDLLSYEAYMLNFLAWIFDLNTTVALQAVSECGAIEELLAYFKWAMIENDGRDAAIISATVDEFLTQQGIDHEFIAFVW